MRSYASVIGESAKFIMCIPTHSTNVHFKKPLLFVMWPFHSLLPDWYILGTSPVYAKMFSSDGKRFTSPISDAMVNALTFPIPGIVSISLALASARPRLLSYVHIRLLYG